MQHTMTRLIAASAALALTAGSASAITIYQDDFSGTSGGLNGTTPDIGANNWVAGASFGANGAIASAGTGGAATLEFNPVDGLVYTLDVSLTDVTGDGQWLGLGFGAGQPTFENTQSRFINANLIGKAWMIYRGDTSTNGNVAWLGSVSSGTSDSEGWSPDFPGGDEIDMRIELDTTGGTGAWTATWFAKLPTSGTYSEVRPEATLLNETINSVGVAYSSSSVDGTITSFSLTSEVPEPSSLALMGLGGLLIARRRRN